MTLDSLEYVSFAQQLENGDSGYDLDLPAVRRQVAVDFWPHPVSAEGRHWVIAEEGDTLADVFGGEIFLDDPAVAHVNGASYSRKSWNTVTLRAGDVAKVRRTARDGGEGSNPVAIILSIAVLVAAPFAAAALAGPLANALGITTAAGLAGLTSGLTAVIGTVGLLIINALFPPRLPKDRVSGEAPRQYSLSGGANRVRLFQPLLWVLGTHRVWPDLVAREYTEFDGNGDQFLNQIFDYGLGLALQFADDRIGKTAITDYDSVTTQRGVRHVTLVKGNVDTLAGGNIGYEEDDRHTITRRTADNTTRVAFDVASVHFLATDGGELEGRATHIRLQYRMAGTSVWTTRLVTLESPDGAEARNAVRRSFDYDVVEGEYDLRVQPAAYYAADDDLTRITVKVELVQLRAFQDETADFLGRNALAIRAKATGQFYGRLQQVSSTVTNGPNNPADVYLAYLRGYLIDGKLVAGMGLAERRIDMASIDAWRQFCTDNELTCNVVFEDARDRNDAMRLICQCGWGSVDKQTGKYGVLWEDAGRPMTAVINPENVLAGTLSIGYQNEGLADEVTGTFLDASNDYLPTPIRRKMPGVEFPKLPVDIDLEGITNGDQAAKELNRTVAGQFYHTRVITWEMDLDEGMAIARGDVVGASHGLIGSGSGGRFISISEDRRSFEVTADPMVGDDPIAAGYIWIWDLLDNVVARQFTRTSRFNIRLDEALPSIPQGYEDDPTAYRFMAFSEQADIEMLRITGKEFPSGRVKLTARDETILYYDHRTTDLEWTPVDGRATAQSIVGGFSVTEAAFGVRVFSWSELDGPVVGYRIRYGPAGSSFANMRDLHQGLLVSSPAQYYDRPEPGTWRFGIVAVLENGEATTPAYTTATLARPGAVAHLEVEVYRVVGKDDDPPDRPGMGEGSYDFNTKTLTPPDDWVGPAFPNYNRNQVVYACTATADTAEGAIWTPDDNDWVGPFVVGDANDLDIIYRRFQMPPTSAPAASNGVPAGWYTNVADVPAGLGLIYIAIGHRRRGQSQYIWQLPTQLEGQDATAYKELEAYRVVSASAAAPATPGASGSYHFGTSTFTPPSSWVGPAFPAYGRNQVVYAVTATADSAGGVEWTAGVGDWQPNPPVIVGNADDLEIIYRRFTSAPSSAPAASTGIPSGWYNRVSSVPSGNGLIYQSTGHRQRGSRTYTWQLPTPLEVRSIISVVRASNGLVTIRYSDGTTDSFTVRDGDPGNPGAPGQNLTVQSAVSDSRGNVLITFSDGTTITVPAGGAGRGIDTIVRDNTTGIVTITYDDGTTTTFTVMDGGVGADGSSTEWIYRATASNVRPATPSQTSARRAQLDYVPPFWNDDPVSGTYVWVSSRRKPAGVNTVFGNFSTPTPFRGPVGQRGPAGPRIWQQLWGGTLTIGPSMTATAVSSSGLSGYDSVAILTRSYSSFTSTWYHYIAMLPVSALNSLSTGGWANTTFDYGVLTISGGVLRIRADAHSSGPTSKRLLKIWGVSNP